MVWVVIAIVCAIAGYFAVSLARSGPLRRGPAAGRAAVGAFIGQNKGQAGLGLVLGLLLGIIGLIIIALVPGTPNHVAAHASGPSMGGPSMGAGPSMGGGPSLEPQTADNAESRLKRLDALRALGALTEVEYQAQRQRVIEGL
jgi:hypothetical protein